MQHSCHAKRTATPTITTTTRKTTTATKRIKVAIQHTTTGHSFGLAFSASFVFGQTNVGRLNK